MVAFLLFIVLVLLAFLVLTGPDSFVRRKSRR
jgi:hypothetical protein